MLRSSPSAEGRIGVSESPSPPISTFRPHTGIPVVTPSSARAATVSDHVPHSSNATHSGRAAHGLTGDTISSPTHRDGVQDNCSASSNHGRGDTTGAFHPHTSIPTARSHAYSNLDHDKYNPDRNRHDGSPRDPPWDSHARDGFHFTPGRDSILRDRRNLGPRHGPTWTHFNADLQDEHFTVDPITGMLSPWIAPRPDYGVVLCHPVSSSLQFQDKTLFMSAFTRRFEIKTVKHFVHNQPRYDPSESFLSWYSRFVRFYHDYGVYIPPAHTLRDNEPLGVWYDDLPSFIQIDVLNVFAGLLATSLKSKSTGLLSDPAMAQIVQQHEDGYVALYELNVYAGHPHLQTFPALLPEPRQDADCCLATHLTAWQTYLQHKALHGLHLSDRYFLQQFCRSLHPMLQSDIAQWLEQEASRVQVSASLPGSFVPARLFSKILQRVKYRNHDALALKTPRECVKSSQPVRALLTYDSRHDDALLVAALSSGACSCFLCGNPDHLVPTCPRFSAIQADPYARRALARLFTDKQSDTNTPSSGNSQPKRVRAILADDDAVPGPEDNDRDSGMDTLLDSGAAPDSVFPGSGPDFL